jgi:hypothetical protein
MLVACDGTPQRIFDGAGDGASEGTLPLPDLGPPSDGASPHDGAPPNADGAPPSPDGGVPTDSGQNPDSAPALHAARYLTGRRHSPLTPYVVSELKKIVAGTTRDAKVFSKIGNSITVSSSFMHCFAGSAVDLDGRTQLTPTIAHFDAPIAGGKTPFDRKSLCATVGWAASHALKGSPSPLSQEISAASPRFALVMYGSNDIGWNNIFGYANNMLDIADQLVGAGVIPILSSIPPRDDNASADAQVPRYNLIVRGIAQGLQVPFVDFHRELLPLPKHGLSGDKLHPSTYSSGGYKACVFTAAGLQHGYNVRNLLAIEALDRVKRAVIDGQAAPDAPGPKLVGDGSPAKPYVIGSLPFTHMADTSQSPHKVIASYSGCNASQDESGPELYYKLELSAAKTVRIMVFDRSSVDIDVHLLDSSGAAAGCLERDDKEIVRSLAAGTYYLVLDTYVSSSSGAKAGEYLLTVMVE